MFLVVRSAPPLGWGGGRHATVNEIQAVKDRADIVDIVGQSVALKRAGRTFKAPCPFHQEKTPSFVVNPERQTWHCFGACSTGGDVFQFLMRRDNLTFGEALRQLAAQVGVEVGGSDAGPREDYGRLLAANDAAAAFFRHLLGAHPAAEAARAYVAKRGVDAATEEAFGLGFALDSYDSLRAHLAERGFSEDEMLQAGLLSEGEHNRYDRFRNRLIFPIRDDRGRVIGFGGRVLGDALPKYLNSPQTPLFDKSGVLYALDRAKDAIRASQSAVVVEGYMDVIAAHQFGITNVVATLGTALTERHVALLKRFTKRVILAMDADAAGIEAAMRGDEVVRRAGASDPDAPVETTVDWTGMVRLHAVSPVDVHVFTVPSGKDPDEAIRADPAAFSALAERAVPPFQFRLRHELAKVDRADSRAMLELADRLLPVIGGVSDRSLQSLYLSQLATATGVREEELGVRLRDVSGATPRPTAVTLRERGDSTPVALSHGPVGGRAKQEALALRLLYSYACLRTDGALLEEDLFTDAANRYLFQVWRGSPDLSLLPELLDPAMAGRLSEVLQVRIPPFDDDQAARALIDAVARMRLQRLDQRKRLLAASLGDSIAEADGAAMLTLARDFLAGGDALPEGADAEAAFQALTDTELGMRLHQMEAALRQGPRPEPGSSGTAGERPLVRKPAAAPAAG